jgi:hypothetical protein
MEKSIKTSISLPPKIYNKAKIMADEMGLPFSTFLSVLIAEKAKQEERKK